MQCDKCGRIAVFFQEYSGQHLCKYHFNADVEAKAKYEIRRNHWMAPGDHIAVAHTGEKNSSALLYFLKKLTSDRRDIRISAITIDEGIDGFRDPECAKRIAEQLDTECIRGSFQEGIGISLDEIVQKKGNTISCTYCRVIRNFLLTGIAAEHGVTKLAFGDTLDDGAESVLKNLLQGTPERLEGFKRTGRRTIPRIRPFISVPQKEVALYADLHLNGCNQSCCPYKNDPFGKDVQTMLNDYTSRHPATKYALTSLGKNLTGRCGSLADLIPACEHCGELSEGECPGCRILGEVTTRGN